MEILSKSGSFNFRRHIAGFILRPHGSLDQPRYAWASHLTGMVHDVPQSAINQARILRLNLHDALKKSHEKCATGVPFPVHFRNVGALDAWRAALCATPEARAIRDAWARPERINIEIRREILAYYEHYCGYALRDRHQAVPQLRHQSASVPVSEGGAPSAPCRI